MRPRSFAPTFLLSVAAVSVVAPWAAAAELRPEYVEILRQYARGERTEAVTAIGSWSEREIGQQLAAVQARVVAAERCPACPNAVEGLPLKAAVMLHADRDEAERPASTDVEQPRPCPGHQARIAGAYAGLLTRLPETKDFARRFFLAMAWRSQWNFCIADARRFGREGLDRFPRDPEVLLTFGSVHELGATQETDAGLAQMDGVPSGRQDVGQLGAQARKKWFQEARRSFSEAVAIDPDLVIARVRLGRVLWRLGETDMARSALTEALEAARDPVLLYLSHLFLGQVHEDAGRLPDAVMEYRAALEVDPKAQSAAVALAQGLRLSADPEGARQVMERALSHAGRGAARDIYWDYVVGNAVRFPEVFTELRRETGE
jgi:tetratricopeptide (TPR) repeat protein